MSTAAKPSRIARQAARTQHARRAKYAAIAARKPAWLIQAQTQALRISEESLIRETGSPAKARAAEIAYIESLVQA